MYPSPSLIIEDIFLRLFSTKREDFQSPVYVAVEIVALKLTLYMIRSRPNPRPKPARTEASLDRPDRNREVSKTETGPDRHISGPDRPKTEAQTSVGLGRSKFRAVGPGRPKVGPARAKPVQYCGVVEKWLQGSILSEIISFIEHALLNKTPNIPQQAIYEFTRCLFSIRLLSQLRRLGILTVRVTIALVTTVISKRWIALSLITRTLFGMTIIDISRNDGTGNSHADTDADEHNKSDNLHSV
jgi:hypothetical protein